MILPFSRMPRIFHDAGNPEMGQAPSAKGVQMEQPMGLALRRAVVLYANLQRWVSLRWGTAGRLEPRRWASPWLY